MSPQLAGIPGVMDAGYSVLKALTFCYGHRIVGHAGPCRHLHGHTGRVEIVCRGPLDDLGMVVDFAEIRRLLETWILEHWDHRMVLQAGDPLAAVLRAEGEPVDEMQSAPTAENMARTLFDVARAARLPVCEVRFWESDTSMASYTAASGES
jgi:6-pyruvoyltetrahydropterin/6-carboxytetrahydropterin synthase